MALVRIDHVPESIGVNLPLNVILPDPGKMGEVPVAKRKVLYLLHGLSDDASAWQRYTSIETLAAAYGCDRHEFGTRFWATSRGQVTLRPAQREAIGIWLVS